MSLIFWGEISAAGDVTLSSIIDTPGTRSRKSISDLIVAIAGPIIASDTVVKAAAAAAVADAIETAPQLPVIRDSGEYLSVELSPSGRVTRGTRKDGYQEIPLADIAGARISREQSGEYLRATVTPAGRVLEDALGPDGLVPSWVLAAWKRRMSTLGVDVIVVAGQSNAGDPEPQPVAVNDADSNVMWWNRATAAVETVPASSSSLWASVGRAYVAANPNRGVIVVPVQVGATGFTSTSLVPAPAGYHTREGGTWDRTLVSDPKNLAQRLRADVLDAMVGAGPAARLTALVWAQGEDDTVPADNGSAALSQSQYAAKMDDLFAWFRGQVGAPTLPVIIRSMVPEWVKSESAARPAILGVNAAQVDAPRRITGAAFVHGPANMLAYNQFRIHYSGAGMAAGARLIVAALYRARLNHGSTPPMPPQDLTVKRSGTVVTIEWEHPPCRATAFTVQISVNGGAWSTVPLSTPTAISATATIPADARVSVRASTTNPVGTSDYSMEVSA